jgi:hypothetical protein
MRLYFGLTIVALGFAGISGAPLSWDGSYILFKILDLQSSIPAHDRFINIPLHWVVLFVSHFTNDLSILQMVFGLVYAAIPLMVLVMSWWVVRGHAETLFIWAALGIGLGTLPGQFCFICEAILAVLLFWPVILAILVRMHKNHVPIVLMLVIATFFAHFVSIMLFILGAGLAFAIGLRSRDDRRWMWMWAFGFGAMAALKSLIFLVSPSAYEMSQLSTDVMKFHFDIAVAGLPLMSVICTWFAASMIFISQLLSRYPKHNFSPIIHSIGLISLTIAGGLLVIWARDPYLWRYAIAFRSWALFISFPFIMLAALEALIRSDQFSINEKNEWNYRLKTLRIIGVVFLLVLSIQSTAWFNLTSILRETIVQSVDSCISISSIGWLTHTPLNNWTTPSHAILLQGKAPQKLVLNGDGCTEASFSEAIRIAPWDLRSRTGGWFDLHLSGILPAHKR